MSGSARIAGARSFLARANNVVRQSRPSLGGAAIGLAAGGGLLGGALTAGAAQLGERIGRGVFASKLGNSQFFTDMAASSNKRREQAHTVFVEVGKDNKAHSVPYRVGVPASTPIEMERANGRLQPKFIPQTATDKAAEVGGYVGAAGGGLLGLGATAALQSIFATKEPEQALTPLPVAPTAQQASSPVPAGPAPTGLVALNAEQVKKAQQRALEQAALNQYYAEQLLQYPVQ